MAPKPPHIISVKRQPTTKPAQALRGFGPSWYRPPQPQRGSTPGYTPPAAAPRAAPAPPDPRDASYWARVAQAKAQRDAQRAKITQDGTYDASDLKDNLRKIAEARVKGLGEADVGHNKQGLFYSTVLSKAHDEIEKGAHDQEESSNEGFRRRENARQTAIAGLLTDGQIEASALDEAILRRLQLDQQAPVPEADPEAASTVDSAVASALSRITGNDVEIHASKAHGGAKWKYRRRASDGQLIPIGPA